MKCVSKEPATSAYCKDLLKPEHGGCCEYCKYRWSADESKCVSTVDLSSTAELSLHGSKADADHAAFARKMVTSLTWGVLSTTSTRSEGTSVGASFGNPYSFADVAGVPYFYASGMDASMIDVFGSKNASSRASLAMSHASLMLENGTMAEAACRIGDGLGDPENPPCARLVISGTMSKVVPGSAEDESARAALFEKHPSFKNYPKDHGFYVAKLTLDGIWLISAYGGAAIVQPKDYFAAPDVKAVVPEAREPAATMLTQTEPWPWQHAKMARWMVSSLVWGVLSTTSRRTEGTSVGDAFGNPYSFADVAGVPYFYAAGMDASMIDLFGSESTSLGSEQTSTRASLSLSEAALGGSKSFVWNQKCKIGEYLGDPENPPCGRLVLTGTMSKVAPGSDEEGVARAALLKKHPSFAFYPKDHGFYVAKMNIETLWLIDMYGGAQIVSPGDYFAIKSSAYSEGPLLV